MITMIESLDDAVTSADATPAPVNVATQALALVGNQVAAFNNLEAGFVELEKRYANVVYAVNTTTGLADAKKARAEIREVRFSTQNLLKDTTRPLNQLKAEVTALADGIVARIMLTETPIDEQIKVEETRKATEKAAKEQAERELAAAIDAHFSPLRMDFSWVTMTSEQLDEKFKEVQAIEVSLEVFGARAGEAALLQSNTLESLATMRGAAQAIEANQAHLAEQQRQLEASRQAIEAELAEGRRQLAEQQAKAQADQEAAEQQLADQRAALAAEQQAAQDKIDAEHAAARAAQDAIDAAARQALQDAADEAARVAREAAEIERQRLDAEAQAARVEADRVATEARAAIELANAKELQLRDAAPALLAALQFLVGASAPMTPQQEECWISIRAAINQATGDQA